MAEASRKKTIVLLKKTGLELKPHQPTIGIIGGCGVMATIDIENEIVKAAQRLMFPLTDQDYPNLLVYQYTQFHDRNDAICFNCNSPNKQYIDCANKLASIGAEVLIFACNTAHVYIELLQKKIKIPVINMIQEVVEFATNKFPELSNKAKIGLLSTVATKQKKIYQKAFASKKISIITPDTKIMKQVMQAIYLIKIGIHSRSYLEQTFNKIYSNSYWLKKTLQFKDHPYKKILIPKNFVDPSVLIYNAIQHLSAKGCTHIVLGCTELPLVIKNRQLNCGKKQKIILINPNKIIAEAVVNFCIKNKLNKN